MFELGSSFFLSRVTFLTFRRHLCVVPYVRLREQYFLPFFPSVCFQFGASICILRAIDSLSFSVGSHRCLCSFCCFLWRILVVRLFFFLSSEQAHIVKYVFHKCMRNEIEYADDSDDDYAKKQSKMEKKHNSENRVHRQCRRQRRRWHIWILNIYESRNLETERRV